MRDSELVLRFIAYDRALEEYRGDFKHFLDQTVEYYEGNWDTRKDEAEQALVRLDRALKTTSEIFGKDSFKKWIGDKFERVINRAVFDCITRYFAEEHVASAAQSKKEEIYGAFKEICKTQEFRDAIEKTPKTVTATRTRINMWGSALAQTLNLTYDQGAQRIHP
jgi:hypothetical protein